MMMSSQDKDNNALDLGYDNQAVKNATLNGMAQTNAEDKGFFTAMEMMAKQAKQDGTSDQFNTTAQHLMDQGSDHLKEMARGTEAEPASGFDHANVQNQALHNFDRADLQNQSVLIRRQTPTTGLGTDLNIGGTQIHLDPGASITIGADGQIKPNNNQLSANSIQKTNFPFDHQINHGLEIGMNPDPVSRKVSTLGTRMDMANDTRSQYSRKGLDATAMKLGNDEQSSLSNQINQLQDQNKGLSLNNNQDLNNELQM